MADPTQERTEQATQHRLDEASSQGQVAYSRELVAALVFFLVLLAIRFTGPSIARSLELLMRRAFTLEDYERVAQEGVAALFEVSGNVWIDVALPLLATMFIVSALGGFLQVGFSINPRRIRMRWEKLDPAQGMKKLLSARSLFSVGLSLAKMLVVGVVVWVTLRDVVPRARGLGSAELGAILALFTETVLTIGLRVGALLLLLGLLDLIWQRWRHSRDMMMTKEEVKEDRKRSEGDARVKGRIRQIQRELARARMMQDVKSSTVVVRNPVHYAVALRYEAPKDSAPRVVAKGRNLVALRIVAVAEEAGVPVHTDPPLARDLYRTVPLGRVIPEELFRAVAGVLAWVYTRKGHAPRRARSERRS